MPQISVIVPVYNAELYLHRCIDSILSQTFPDFELILVDDGSPDQSGQICDEYAAQDPRVLVIHQKNAGVAAARNAGIEQAFSSKSNWITFVDSDDTIAPDFLKAAIDAAEKKNLDIFLGGISRICPYSEAKLFAVPEVIQNTNKSLTESDYTELLKANYIASSYCKLFKKTLIGDTRFRTGVKFGEDLQFVFDLFNKSPRCLAVPTIYYCYFEAEGSLTTHIDCKKLQDVIDTYRYLFAFSNQMGFTHNFLAFISKRWIDDLKYLQQLIVSDCMTKTEKLQRLKTLTQDKLLNQILKNSHDPYLSRYATHPLVLLCYHDYKRLRNRVKGKSK